MPMNFDRPDGDSKLCVCARMAAPWTLSRRKGSERVKRKVMPIANEDCMENGR